MTLGTKVDASDEATFQLGGIGARTHQAIIAGGGPTGLMLAGELALAGVDVAIIERRESQDLAGMRAGGLHMRTLEVLDQRGLGERFVSQGQRHQVAPFHEVLLDVSDFPTRRNYFLALPQNQIERTLAEWVEELGVRVYRGCEVTGFVQDDHGVEVVLSDGSGLHASFLVGCDGSRSVVRKGAGIEFAGWEPTKSWLIAEARWAQEPKWGVEHDLHGTYALGKMDDPGQIRIVLAERELKTGDDPTFDEVQSLLVEVYGADFGVHTPTWISRFTDRCRQAAAYRDRRVLLAGDAAHIHPPMGGQGLNIGLQDAVNLGWKLAQVIKGISPESLLDTYHAERHPVAALVLRNTMADVALQRRDPRSRALGEIMSELAVIDGARKHLVAVRSGLGVRYDLGDGHPLVGRRLPDLGIQVGQTVQSTYDFLHDARPVLFDFGSDLGQARRSCTDAVKVVSANALQAWDLPVVGPVQSPEAALVRPDGYVAWAGSWDDDGLGQALQKWFGASAADTAR